MKFTEPVKIDDTRDNIGKATRSELLWFAEAHGVKEVTPNTPADTYTHVDGTEILGIRTILRQKGLTKIIPARRVLGQNPPNQPAKAAFLEANGLHIREPVAPQVEPQHQQEVEERKAARVEKYAKPVSNINMLRRECQRLGIKMDRRDNLITLKQKIDAHGANAVNGSK